MKVKLLKPQLGGQGQPLRNENRRLIFLALLLITTLTHPIQSFSGELSVSGAEKGNLDAGELRRSGTIHLEVSCVPEVREEFETAVALLHSFFYDEARRRFEAIAKKDPDCAMAWWGVAMTWYHPLWAPPSIEERAKGLEAVMKAKAIGVRSPLERGFLEAIDAFYTTNELPSFEKEGTIAGCSCCGPQAHSARARAFHDRLEQLQQEFPDHVEVNTFLSLAILGTTVPQDKSYRRQKIAGAILEPLFESNPDHPGIAHYLIHAYDYPELADRALKASRRYDDIAPWVPHALHMPTHIYTRLGMWEDSIEGNVSSSMAARNHSSRYYEGGATMDDLHAMDYLAFAYLQTARDHKAGELIEHLKRVERVVPGNEFASAYAIASIPARHTLERGEWEEAASLKPLLPEFVGRFPFAMAHVAFANGVGAARSGDLDGARQAVDALGRLGTTIKDTKFLWWVGQVDIQRLSAEAWLAHAEGKTDRAEALFREAAEQEDKAGTHPVTPGQVLPAREQLAEFLMETDRSDDALAEFEKSLKAFPRRYRSHIGAARAALVSGNGERARYHAVRLLEMAGEHGERKADLREMQEIVNSAKDA